VLFNPAVIMCVTFYIGVRGLIGHITEISDLTATMNSMNPPDPSRFEEIGENED
jgi:hypothetical protein